MPGVDYEYDIINWFNQIWLVDDVIYLSLVINQLHAYMRTRTGYA